MTKKYRLTLQRDHGITHLRIYRIKINHRTKHEIANQSLKLEIFQYQKLGRIELMEKVYLDREVSPTSG